MWCKCGRLIAQLEIAAFCQFQPLRAVGGSRVLGEGGGRSTTSWPVVYFSSGLALPPNARPVQGFVGPACV